MKIGEAQKAYRQQLNLLRGQKRDFVNQREENRKKMEEAKKKSEEQVSFGDKTRSGADGAQAAEAEDRRAQSQGLRAFASRPLRSMTAQHRRPYYDN